MHRRLSILIAIAALLPLVPLAAQSTVATVTGIVTDAENALVPGVAVTIRNVDTNINRTITSSADGSYTVTNLAPGNYEITAEFAGFRKYQRSGIVLQVSQILRADIRMEIGAVSESVTITGTVPPLNTESGTIKGDVIVHQEIQELPLSGRDFTDLALFVPGVLPEAEDGHGSNLSVNGARSTNTNFYIDGFNNRNARGATAQVRPNLDAMQEFKMEASGFSAEYGRFAGGVLNMALRSGTNDFHGSLFDYLRNDKYDARGFFEQDKNKLRRNQFGATLSGPILRNRTFFLFSYEGQIERNGITMLSHVPTALEQRGDFSQSIDNLGRPVYVKDPLLSGTCSASNRAACFSNNIIPASRLSQVGLNIAKWFPLPNRADPANNYLSNKNNMADWHSFMVKIDHRFGDKDTVAFRMQRRDAYDEDAFNSSPLGIFGQTSDDMRALYGADWTHMFSPTFLMEVRAGVARNTTRDEGYFKGRDMAKELGLPTLVSEPEFWDFPIVSVLNYAELGSDAGLPSPFATTDLQFGAKFTWVRSKHVVKGGMDYSRVRYNQPFFNNQRGTYNFQGRWTNAPMADMLLGMLHSSTRQTGFTRNYWRVGSWGAFLNDDFKVSRNLTLNLGLRYEVNKSPVDRYDRLMNYIPALDKIVVADTSALAAVADYIKTAGLTGRIAGAKEAGFSRSLLNTDYTNFGPRVGIAWRPFGSEKTVIRTGYGIFYAGETLNPLRALMANNFPFAIRQNFQRVGNNPNALTLANPFPAERAVLQGVTTASGVQDNAATAYLQTYNFTIEHALWGDAVIEAGYSGSKGTHLGRRYDYNQPLRTRELYEAGAEFPRPIKSFNTINYMGFGTNSIYNAFQFSFRKRGSRDFFYRLNYSYSKSIDDASQWTGNSMGGFPDALDSRNLRLDRARSDFDIGHVFSAVYSWNLPVGHGRRYLTGLAGVPEVLLGGWQLSGTSRLSTGAPFTVRTNEADTSLGESDRPNRIGKGVQPEGELAGKKGADYPWFRIADFEAVPCVDPSTGCPQSKYGFSPFAFGNSARNILDGPGIVSFDVGLRKNVRIREGHSLQLRLDCFNMLNRTNFRLPNNFFDGVGGGYITRVGTSARSGGPRMFQAALTYRF